jgi:hypothetical protein
MSRLLILGRDRRRLTRLLGEFRDCVPPVFVVVMPRTLGWLDPCLKLVPEEVPLYLIGNGVPRREMSVLAKSHPTRRILALSVLPGSFVRHGTVLDLIVAATGGDFFLLDHDCYVFEPRLFRSVKWREDEFLGFVDLPGFSIINKATGMKFPRTHFLAVRRDKLLELRSRYGIGCEKARRTPRRVVDLLAGIGLGDHNFPPARMRFYDTLQLAMAVAFAEGWKARELPAEEGSIAHIGGTARQRNQLGVVPGT